MFPANIILKAFPPRFIIGGACVIFGSLVAGLGGAQNYATLIAIRILVGCSQSMIQGLTIYGSLWFRRNEMATVGSTLQCFRYLRTILTDNISQVSITQPQPYPVHSAVLSRTVPLETSPSKPLGSNLGDGSTLLMESLPSS